MNHFGALLCGFFMMVLVVNSHGQSPHGENLQIDCASCHTSDSWTVIPDSISFAHSSTGFDLEGQHGIIDCRQCHTTLAFDEAPSKCVSCHLDIHQQSVGDQCARCHDSNSWLINNITQLHRENSFPLEGAHVVAECVACHKSETELRFDPIGTDCFSCHQQDYEATTSPDHDAAGYSKECTECHSVNAFDWSASNINHDFFPLTLGHEINDCARCHTGTDYSSLSPDCFGCHEDDYYATTSPNHQTINFTTSCVSCHTTNPGWQPAEYKQHDVLFFPIYSGSHRGEWDKCLDCHTDENNYAIFTCITCHEKGETDSDHDQVNGYSYTSTACLACHPNGENDGTFNHDATNFPLTGEHTTLECIACHANGYAGTPTDCFACHSEDYDQSLNPNHVELTLSTDCVSCHTTAPDWNPALFDNHNDFYVLSGAHAIIANDCAACHNGDYNNTPNTCFGCHQNDYDQTTDPSHVESQFSQDCATCHSESAWVPSTFDHDGLYFPIYSGKHQGVWSQCTECHTVPGNFAEFTCVTCHTNPETDEAHNGVGGYYYESAACLACHPTGDADMVFNHNESGFPLTGAHTMVDCIACHSSGYENTPTACDACHLPDYNQTTNPNHTALGLPTDCATCHTTAPGWNPASFDIHDNYYALSGAHVIIANDCVACHNGDYNNTPNTCYGCHQSDYEQTIDPPHFDLQFSQDCASCHNESGWVPSTFDHDAQHFPIYSGKHEGEWSQCLDCHNVPGNWPVFTCVTCHSNPETDEEHNGVGGYFYESSACLACHPTGDADMSFNHNVSAFPLTGAHIVVDCIQCHAAGYQNTPTACDACHLPDYNQTINPNHTALGLSTDCATCHTTEPAWNPASFDVHNEYYVLNGAHALISNQCATCHNGDYNNTPNTCYGCHQEDYNQTMDPSHMTLNFPTDCILCHTETDWSGGEFSSHDEQYFPIYSGDHQGVWGQCTDCHTDINNYAIFTCVTCHSSPETDEEHNGVSGYFYESSACLACHPTGSSEGSFNHYESNFPLTGAHIMVDCIQCHASGYQNTPTACDACHLPDYNQSTNPNHTALGLPTDCATCHTTEPAWNPATFDIHNDYYALNGAHALISNQCATCHNGDYNNTPNTCYGCHQEDYDQTMDPSHMTLNFPTDCALCHTETDWTGAEYSEHDDQYFPIYSGAHQGVWSQCTECHTNTDNYAIFTCITCHANPETDDQHAGVSGYFYESSACLACHPTGDSEGSFNHAESNFPLTGAHTMVECIECHASGYQNTPTACDACHLPDYNQSTNPNHTSLGLPTDCASCHTTEPAWNPATFDIHNDYYALNGAHALIADQCITCHNGDYNNTPNTCYGCHQEDYDQTDDPSHLALNFPTDCALCHSETDWTGAEYSEHDDQYFPIYSGAHQGVWSQCTECHTNINNYAIYTCITCHANPETDDQHAGINGYFYESSACLACHPTGDTEGSFNHAESNFPLTGAHLSVDCIECHASGYQNTPTACDACHLPDYNQSTNPNHTSLGLPTDCASCHTTEPAWNPATFDIHNDYYALNGAHALIADQCVTCHNGDYNNTPNTCYGCHQEDYEQTDDPSHLALNFSTDCASCHSETDWTGAEYSEHDDQYFPIYSGAHAGVWSECTECHTNTGNYSIFTCVTCHANPETDNQHTGVNGYFYESSACFACHPTGEGAGSFDHNNSNFPLTGAHVSVQCIDCHASGYQNTPTECDACHMPDYNQSTNPNHTSLSLPTDCASCHTTEPEWNPATFDIHNDYYVLEGAHANIADQCVTCHNGDYNNTPNTCYGCHQQDYEQTNDPDHEAAQFPTDCASCHSQNQWVPASWDHDDQYFPIYSGKHDGEWSACSQCHPDPNNYSVFTCLTCHEQGETDDQHDQVGGYEYNSNACLACHPDGD
jgi:hypothetical protein